MAEEEIIEVSQAADLPPSPDKGGIDAPVADKPRQSLRDDLKDALKASKEKAAAKDSEENTSDAPKTGKEQDSAKIAAKAPKDTTQSIAPLAPKKEAILAPEGLPADLRAEWPKMSETAQKALIKREADIHKGMTTMDDERNFGKEMQKAVLPYMPLINSSNTTPMRAVTEMFNYAHILQTGTPQAKGQLLHQLAQRWGADMRFTPQVQAQPQHQIQTLQQQLQQTQEQLARMPETIKQQQESAKLQAVIETFAADPKNKHYARVKPAMAALLSGGVASDMQDAYDKACYADPELRSTLLAEKHQAEEKKRVADLKAKTVQARNASVSVRGSSSHNGVEAPPPKRSLREEIQHNYRAATSH